MIRLDNIRATPSAANFPIFQRLAGGHPQDETDLHAASFAVADQGSLGSCTAYSIAGRLADLLGIDFSEQFLYNVTRLLIENRHGDVGATLGDAMQAAVQLGVAREELCRYMSIGVDDMPTDDAFADALTHRVTLVERVAAPQRDAMYRSQDESECIIADIEACLSSGRSVNISMQIGQQTRYLAGPWQTHELLPCTGLAGMGGRNPYWGGHALILVGHNSKIPNAGRIRPGKFLARNSWGPIWADGGYFGINYETLTNDLIEAFVISGAGNVQIDASWYSEAEVKGWYKRLNFCPDAGGVLYWRNPANGGFRVFCGTVLGETKKNVGNLFPVFV